MSGYEPTPVEQGAMKPPTRRAFGPYAVVAYPKRMRWPWRRGGESISKHGYICFWGLTYAEAKAELDSIRHYWPGARLKVERTADRA